MAMCYNCNGSGAATLERTNSSDVTTIACPRCGGSGEIATTKPGRGGGGGGRGGGGGNSRNLLPDSLVVYLCMVAFVCVWIACFYEIVLGYERGPYGLAFLIALVVGIPIAAIHTLSLIVTVAFISFMIYMVAWGFLNNGGVVVPFAGYLGLFLPLLTGVLWVRIARRLDMGE